jgi:drug/metabolite transporter (DMT)-like permease
MEKDQQEIKKGVTYALLSNILWAFFPVLTVVTYTVFSSMLALSLTTGIAAVFFFGIMLVRGKLHELTTPKLFQYIAVITLCIGIGGYGLYYLGLMYTSPGTASIVGLFEVCSAFIFFNIFHKEAFSKAHIIGTICMIAGALIVLIPKGDAGINIGSVLILCAGIIAPFGNRFQQKARAIASGETIMFLRNAIAAFFFLLIAILSGQTNLHGQLTGGVLLALFANAILIFGVSKLFFIEAIHRVTVTRVIALSSLAPFLTLIIAWVIIGTKPETSQLLALIPLTLGVLLLTDQFPLRKS